MQKAKPSYFALRVRRDRVVLDIDERFWDNTIVLPDGTMQLDFNVATVLQEIRAALYYVATEGPQH